MAKSINRKKYSPETRQTKAEEPVIEYKPVKRSLLPVEFSYKKFERIAKMVPFTQKEWASILHLSERTLQRYSKENNSFGGIYTDRILHIEQLIHIGLETFANANAFYSWLKKEKQVLGNTLNFESLYFTHGIEELINQLGRIQHGVYT